MFYKSTNTRLLFMFILEAWILWHLQRFLKVKATWFVLWPCCFWILSIVSWPIQFQITNTSDITRNPNASIIYNHSSQPFKNNCHWSSMRVPCTVTVKRASTLLSIKDSQLSFSYKPWLFSYTVCFVFEKCKYALTLHLIPQHRPLSFDIFLTGSSVNGLSYFC